MLPPSIFFELSDLRNDVVTIGGLAFSVFILVVTIKYFQKAARVAKADFYK